MCANFMLLDVLQLVVNYAKIAPTLVPKFEVRLSSNRQIMPSVHITTEFRREKVMCYHYDHE